MTVNRNYKAKAQALAEVGRELHALGWVPATSGNFSMRLDATSALLTASGKHKGRLTELDFLAVDLDGRPVDGGQPSAETLLHTRLYRRFPGVNAVLHCHSPSATILSRFLADQPSIELQSYELQKAFAGVATHDGNLSIPIFDNTQDIAALAQQVDDYLEAHPACPAYVIRGHGAYCWSDSLDACQRELEALDFLFHCELELLRLRGGEKTQ